MGSKKRKKGVAPTAEAQRHATYKQEAVTERGFVVGHAYRRQPWFETLYARDEIDGEQVRALRFYRNAFETSERSETRCALNREAGGGESDGPGAAVVAAKRNLGLCEAGIGALVHTLRSVALHDVKYRELAMQRYGSRDADWIVDGEHRTRPAPKSGRHPTIIKEEFLAGVRMLVGNVTPLTTTLRAAA